MKSWRMGAGLAQFGTPAKHLRRVDALILAILTVGGIIVTIKAPFLFLGARILLASCFSLTALLIYRSYWGVAVSVPSALTTIWMFGDPLTAIRLIGEMVLISWLNRKPKCDRAIRSGRIIRHVVAYAALIGCPFLFLTEVYINGTGHEVAMTLTYKNFINSVFNVLVAYAVYSWIELRKNKRIQGSSHQISFKTLTSVVLMLTCILLSYTLITREFAIASDRAQVLIMQRNHSFATLIEKLHMSNPIQETDDLASILIDHDSDMRIKDRMSGTNGDFGDHENEYDLDIHNGKIKLVKPKDETDVWYSLRPKGLQNPLHSDDEFFLNVLPKLTDYHELSLISPQLTVRAPKQGSHLDRLMAGYWVYKYPNSSLSDLKDIEIITPVYRFVNTLSESSNAALQLLAEVVLVALIISNLLARKLTNEWSAIIPTPAGANGITSDMEELYRQSPIAEISSSVDSINERTTLIVKAKKEIEYLNSITQRQLSTAAEIQSFFLTNTFPKDYSYRVTALTRPAYDVGGDWYDVFTVNGHSFFVVADVCDKGVGSALFMSVFRTLIRYSTRFRFNSLGGDNSPAAMVEIISNVNHYMSTNHGSCMYFATVFFAHISEDSKRLDFVSAGHESVLLRRAYGTFELLEATGPALGIFDGANYVSSSTTFEVDDWILAYTDGVTDARSPQDKGYGLDQLKSFFSSHNGQSVEQMKDSLLKELDDYMDGAEQFDDITMMFIQRKE